jgi:selenophosphate synthetase-related protein
MIVDLDGRWHKDKPYWNAVSGKQRDDIRAMWELLPEVAETGMVTAAKDISNAGVFGTLLMMLELNKRGAIIDINEIPKPKQETDIVRWLKAFQSYGFLLAGDPEHALDVEAFFQGRGIACRPIGRITEQPSVYVDCDGERIEFWDFDNQPLTGITFANRNS